MSKAELRVPAAVRRRLARVPDCWDLLCLGDDNLAFLDQAEGLRFVDLAAGSLSPPHPVAAPWIIADGARRRFAVTQGIVDRTGKLLVRYAVPPKWHTEFALSPDGTLAARSRQLSILELRRVGTGEFVFADDTGFDIDCAVFSPDGKSLVSARVDQPLRVYAVPGGEPRVLENTRQPGAPRKIGFSPDGRWLADLGRGRDLLTLRAAETGEVVGEVKLGAGIQDFAFVPGRARLALATDSALVIVDTRSCAVEAEAQVGREAVELVDVSPSGEFAVTAGATAGLLLWELAALGGPGLAVPLPEPARAAAGARRRTPPPRRPAAAPARKAAAPEKLRDVFFAVPASVMQEDLLDAAATLHSTLEDPPVQLGLLSEPDEVARGLRWFTLLASPGRRYRLAPWIECLQLDLGSLDVALVDDEKRVYLYERYVSSPVDADFSLLSRDAQLQPLLGQISVEHAAGASAIEVAVRQHHPDATPPERFRALRGQGRFALVIDAGQRLARPRWLPAGRRPGQLVGRADYVPPRGKQAAGP